MRARLLDSALELVAIHGMVGVTIDNVTARAKVSRGTFYHYFDAPDSLVRTLALEISSDMLGLAEQMVLEHKDPAERLSIGVRALMYFCAENPVLGGFTVRIGWPVVDSHLLFDNVIRDVESGLREGRFKDMPASIALNFIVGTVIGGIYAMIEAQGAARGFPEHVAAVVLRALGIKPKEIDRIVGIQMHMPDMKQYTGILKRVTVGVRATHLEANLSSGESAHDEDHAHHDERG